MNQILGNTKLVEHGIQTEVADLRFHVGVVVKKVFVFEQQYALQAIHSGKFPLKPTHTGAFVTAKGYCVPHTEIKGCRMVDIPPLLFARIGFSKQDNTSTKGKKAERLVNLMIQQGYLSTVLASVSADDQEMQVDGIDIVPDYAQAIQVKCDWKAGPKELGGYGNLYLQWEECNPLKAH